MPYGSEARGRPTVRLTVSVAGSITLIELPERFVTHTRPFGAIASARGAVPTRISASRVFCAASSTLTELLSGFTTQTRPGVPATRSTAMLPDAAGAFAVSGRCTRCRNVRLCR